MIRSRRAVREQPEPRVLAPEPHRGRRNEPAYVRLVAEEIAALRELPLEELARATSENACRLFRIPMI